jgi:hypothetical protein
MWDSDEADVIHTELAPAIEAEVIKTDFSQELNIFFSHAVIGEQQIFSHTPFGKKALIKVEKRYYSASGRICLDISVLLNDEQQQKVVCESGEDSWVITRNVIINNK